VKASTPEPSKKKTLDEQMEEAIRESKIGFLDKALKEDKDGIAFDDLYTGRSLVSEYPEHLPLLATKLRHVNETAEMDSAADAIINIISEDELGRPYFRGYRASFAKGQRSE